MWSSFVAELLRGLARIVTNTIRVLILILITLALIGLGALWVVNQST